MLLDLLRAFVRENVPEHLRGLWTPDGETQLLFADSGKPVRIPWDGNGDPHYDDSSTRLSLDGLQALGVSGWNHVDGRSVFSFIDVDGVNHSAGHDAQTLDDLIARLLLIPEVEIVKSKSGSGFHLRVYFNPDSLPIAKIRKHHTANGQRVLKWLGKRVGSILEDTKDCCGGNQWIWHADQKPGGFEVIKPSTANMPAGWDDEIAEPAAPVVETPHHEAHPLTPKHQKLIDHLTARGEAEWDGKMLVTHTHHLLMAAQEASLKIGGDFTTIATGKSGPSDRNCWAYPDLNGSWRVYRFKQGTKEHRSWWTSAAGWTTTRFNCKKKFEVNFMDLAADDELFHDSAGNAYITTTIRGVTETLPIMDRLYRAKLRVDCMAEYGKIPPADSIVALTQQLEAIALLERPEYPVAIRVAEHGGRLYIDLANRERQIVEVHGGKWQIVTEAPVRFLRPFGLLPLPVPEPGGKPDDLRQFINVDAEDVALLLAFIVGCFHPSGPYAVLQLVGEQGSAKSSLMRLIHDFVDPQLAIGNTMPRDERDLLVSAQLRWLMSFDNVDELNRKVSSLLCMIVTGAASANRKLFTDADQSILRAKRPVVLTAIGSVVTASDLLDRTLTLMLPPIPADKRKSEFAIAQELRKDGVRGKIFGYILGGVAAALAGHAKVKRDDMPRLADLFSWATAAEQALEIPAGSAIAAVKRQAAEESQHIFDDSFGQQIIKLCKEGFKGSASDLRSALAKRVALPPEHNPKAIAKHLREIAPDLRRNGYCVSFSRHKDKRIIELASESTAAAA